MVRLDGSRSAGAARWLTIHDDLLRGIAHTLSNRVSTIDAASYMLGLEGSDTAQHAATLRDETGRLEELLRALRLLPRRVEARGEPVMADDAVSGALAVYAHHGDLHGVPCDVAIEGDVPPLFADPVALQHALLVGLTAAGRAAKAQRQVNGDGRVRVHVTGTSEDVHFTITATDVVLIDCQEVEDDAASDADAIDFLLDTHGGRSTSRHGGAQFSVPSLTAARRSGF